MYSTVLSVVLLLAGSLAQQYVVRNGAVHLAIDEQLNFQVLTPNGEVKLRGTLLTPNKSLNIFSKCSAKNKHVCLQEAVEQWMKITPSEKAEECIDTEIVRGTACFDYGNDQWFGGAERYEQLWPIQSLSIKDEAYTISGANYQSVLESFWLTSQGTSISVEPDVPLFIDSNNIKQGSFCMYADNRAPYQAPDSTLRYQLCSFNDAHAAHVHAIKEYFTTIRGSVDERMVEEPVWSTWARYKSDVNEDVVRSFANEILEHNFGNSQLEIDDRWETCYGSLTVDKGRFPDMASLTGELKNKGFRITLWVHPFINTDCEPFYSTALAEGRFVLNEEGSHLTNWWNGQGGHIDYSNSTTRAWFAERLRALISEDGIDAFKFDAGESSYLPQPPRLNTTSFFPDEFASHYVSMAEEFGNYVEVRVGRKTQSKSVFVRMLDKDSRWGLNNGLQALITSLLQFNIAGYSYVLPDMIGGNAYGDKVPKELFIRWLQANLLMPSLQFSVTPWDFDEETVQITQKMLNIRRDFMGDIQYAMNIYSNGGDPINAPVWYLSPTDADALKVNDEYLVNNRALIAPIVVEGATSRDIYLPRGRWHDLTVYNRSAKVDLIDGPTWLRNVTVNLDQVPVFENWSPESRN